MDQGFFCRIRGVDGVPQNCEVAAMSPLLAAGRTDARNGSACVGHSEAPATTAAGYRLSQERSYPTPSETHLPQPIRAKTCIPVLCPTCQLPLFPAESLAEFASS